MALTPAPDSPAWAGAPSTRTWNHSTPTWAFQIAPLVGSVRIAASAGRPASTQASAPLPVHSSSTTDCSSTRPPGRRPRRRRPATAPTIAARPAFMSPAPRPYSHSPSRCGAHGSTDHSADGSGLTTSTCPLRIRDRPPSPAAGQRATTLALPVTSQLNGGGGGLARSGAAASGTSTGSTPSPANARRMTACPAASDPKSVRARTRSHSSASMSLVPSATAARIAWSLAVVAMAGRGRDVQRRIAVEEARRLEPKRDGVDRHDRPLLRARDVVDAEDVPEHHVGVLDRAVALRPHRQAAVRRALRRHLAARPALVRVVRRDPQRVPDDLRALEDRRGRVEQRGQRAAGHELVADRRPEPVRHVVVGDGPRPLALPVV